MKKYFFMINILLCFTLILSACGTNGSINENLQEQEPSQKLSCLPPPEPDGPFGIDLSINQTTIDNYLERPDVTYIDLRMFYDPADFPAIGGIKNLTQTLPGYRVVPWPFIGTLAEMPVANAYEGDTLFTIVWGEGFKILEVTPNYTESEQILNELFPKGEVIFLMCGGAGYSAMTRELLVHKGWSKSMIYSTGGNWHYEGEMAVDMTVAGNKSEIATWRANYALIDFETLHRITP